MVYDIDMLREFYALYPERVEKARKKLGRAMTLAEKILYAHLYDEANEGLEFRRGEDYVNFRPDRVAMQDATAQMALLQFMNAGKSASAVPATVHCDHLIQAYKGAGVDLPAACEANSEVYDFLKSVAAKYGLGFWRPGAGIIHQVVAENAETYRGEADRTTERMGCTERCDTEVGGYPDRKGRNKCHY